MPSFQLPSIVSNKLPQKQNVAPTSVPKNATVQNKKELLHTVQSGESLWIIAEKYYNSGFRAFDIAIANDLPNPDIIEKGQTLKIPVLDENQGEISPEAASTSKITESTQSRILQYTVKSGDYLWKIAEDVYGNGYLWEKIAHANNLINPELIHSGNILTIPI